MVIYRFDGSFDGLLTAVFDSYLRKEEPDMLCVGDAQLPLFYDTLHEVVTDTRKAARVWRKLREKLSRSAATAFATAFLTDNEEFPSLALRFARRAVVSEASIEQDFSDAAVLAVLKESRRVNWEAHRLPQFVRFQKAVDGTYFAMVEPIFDVLPMVISHFRDRFSDQKFIIYDRAHDYGFHFDGEELRRITLTSDGQHMVTGKLAPELLDADESLYQQLWRAYVKYTAIAERSNPRKQRQDMPVRFWKYLTEMNGV